MKRFSILFLLLAALATGCDSSGTDDDTFDVQRYVGTYTGTVETTLATPDETTTTSQTVTLTVAATGGDVSVTIVPADGDPLVLEGTHTDAGATFGFSEDGSTIVIGVDADGDVGGIGLVVVGPIRLNAVVDGRVTRSAVALTADFDVTQGNDALPVGSTVRFDIAAGR